ncbi:hypothetical protein L209DRAFT_8578 [Thermothelomyces heterothallicus CBS 203.75]
MNRIIPSSVPVGSSKRRQLSGLGLAQSHQPLIRMYSYTVAPRKLCSVVCMDYVRLVALETMFHIEALRGTSHHSCTIVAGPRVGPPCVGSGNRLETRAAQINDRSSPSQGARSERIGRSRKLGVCRLQLVNPSSFLLSVEQVAQNPSLCTYEH